MMAGTSSGDGRIGDDSIQQRLHAFVLEGAAAEYGGDLGGQHRAPDRVLQQLRSDRVLVGQEGLHHVIVVIGHQLDQRMASFLRLISKFGGNLLDGVVLTDLGLTAPGEGAHVDQVDDTDEVRFRANRQLHHGGYGIEPILDRLYAVLEARTRTVELVDEADTRHTVAVSLTPHSLALWLYAGDAVEDRPRRHRAPAANAPPQW